MDVLDKEYDYDTDEAELREANKLCKEENYEAIKFCIKHDTFKLIENLDY